jgi:hypothetical protein
MIHLRRIIARLLLPAVAALLLPVQAFGARVGIKYNRAISEYPAAVIADLTRFHADRIDTVMLCFPWNQLEPTEGQFPANFIRDRLKPVLEFCAANRMSVILSNHCEYWGEKGNWSIPAWAQKKPGYTSATACLTAPAVREAHIAYLRRLVDATRDFPAVVGYNLLNEPVAPTKWFVENANGDFFARWEGVLKICTDLRKHLTKAKARQFLIIGNHGAERGFEAFAWKSAGKLDLVPLWTGTLDKIAAQSTTALLDAGKWYADRPKIRTEGYLAFATLGKTSDTEDFGKSRSKPAGGTFSETADHCATYYDYDAVYDYEGLSNAAVPRLEAFYAWRVGGPDGSAKHLEFLDHRHGDRPTPYYRALRDLASGIDSFETLDRAVLPKSGRDTVAFDPVPAAPGISKRWIGTGKLTALKDNLPPGSDSTIAARLVLLPGQSSVKEVIAAHWKDCGVTAADYLTFAARVDTPTTVTLVVQTSRGTRSAPVSLLAGPWSTQRVPLRPLLTDAELLLVQRVGFTNQTKAPLTLLLDEFLIRP